MRRYRVEVPAFGEDWAVATYRSETAATLAAMRLAYSHRVLVLIWLTGAAMYISRIDGRGF